MSLKDGGPAFPVMTSLDPVWYDHDHENSGRHPSGYTAEGTRGLSLRDYFAAKAMQALVGAMSLNGETAKAMREVGEKHGQTSIQAAADSAYDIADAMLEARKA